jgi:putative DNA primase/helicase
MNDAERKTHRARMAGIIAQREAEATKRHESAATDAARRLAEATPCTQHAYLTSKCVKGYNVKVDGSGALIVPLIDTDGKIHSLQKITANGDKRFLPGGRVKGCYHPIGKLAGLLIVCEGYATGASIHECTGHAVAVAFNADNLEPVAVALHIKYPSLKIIIAADDDHLTDGNPGITKAKTAAQAVGGLVAVPLFPAGRNDKATDFNDLHKMAGAGAVKACIDTAAAAMDDWPELQPLIAQIAPEPYPLEALPDA